MGDENGELNEQPASASMELEHAIGFAGSLRNCLQFHPNGRDIVYAAGGCVVVADLSDPHNQVFLRGHDDFITSIAVSPSGRYIASGQRGDNADVIVWDFEEKRLLYRMQSHDHGIAAVSFSHDEKLLLSIGVVQDNRLFVWDMATGLLNAQAQAVQNAAQQDTTCAAWGGFFKDIKRRDTGNYMFATGGGRMLRLWALDPVTGSWPVMGEPLTAHGHIRDYTCLRFSDDRNWLYAGSTSGDMTSFQIKSRSLAMCKQCTQGGVESMLLLPAEPGSTTVLVGGGDGSITKLIAKDNKDLHDVINGKSFLQGKVTSMNVAPDGTEIVLGSHLGFMWRMRLSDMKHVKISEAHHGAITAVTFPKDSSDRFATCSEDGTVVMWDLSDYSVLCKGSHRDGGIPTCIDFALECLVTGWSDGKVRCFDGETGQLLWELADVHKGGVSALCVSHNQRFFMTGGVEGSVRIWDIKSRELVSNMKEHLDAVTCIKIFDDDAHALSGSKDRNIICWDLRHEKRVASLRQRMGGVNSLALYLDQVQVLSVGQDRRLTFWDLRESEPVHAVSLDSEALATALSYSGNFIATGGKDQIVRLWSFDGARHLVDGMGHSGSINSIVFSPDDRQMVSVGNDGCIFVWNIYT